jgi:hypothetical protein
MPSKHLPPHRTPLPLREQSRLPGVNWSAIAASLALAVALVLVVFAWIVAHPRKARSESPTTLEVTSPAPTPLILEPSAPSPLSSPAMVVTPANHHPERQERLVERIPLMDEAPPPLPVPAAPEAKQQVEPPAAQTPAAQPGGETYGTQVLFLNNPAVAADLARRENKLLFVMHISGNFEDSCFT